MSTKIPQGRGGLFFLVVHEQRAAGNPPWLKGCVLRLSACVCVRVYASALYFYAHVVPREILRVTGSLGEERREGKDLLFSEGCVEKGQYEKLRTFRKARGVV